MATPPRVAAAGLALAVVLSLVTPIADAVAPRFDPVTELLARTGGAVGFPSQPFAGPAGGSSAAPACDDEECFQSVAVIRCRLSEAAPDAHVYSCDRPFDARPR